MYRPSADRTRSKRWRSGTRRNKKHKNAHIQVCPMPQVCLVHRKTSGVISPRHPAMAMRLTRCEQKWVDDLRAGLHHVHIQYKRPTESWQFAIWTIYRRINTERMKASGIINAESPSPTGRVQITHPPVVHDVTSRVGEVIRQSTDAVLRAGAALYPRKLDISDRWYPRGN